MAVIDPMEFPGARYPAGRITRPLVGGTSQIPAGNFSLGYVVLDPDGGQVPWHNHEPEEAYFIVSGIGELCVGSEKKIIHTKPFKSCRLRYYASYFFWCRLCRFYSCFYAFK